MEFAHCFFNFTYATCKVIFFMKLFLILPTLYKEKKFINFVFLIKGRLDTSF